jgi:hypothetical protein
LFFLSIRADAVIAHPHGAGEGREAGGRGGAGMERGKECVRADTLCPRGRWVASARTHYVHADARLHLRGHADYPEVTI